MFDQLTGDTKTAAVVPEKLQIVCLNAEGEAADSNKTPFRLDEVKYYRAVMVN